MNRPAHPHQLALLPEPHLDLRGLFRAAQGPVVHGGVGGAPRPVIKMVERSGPSRVACLPALPIGCADGTQASLALVRQHRPLIVAWAAAGAVTSGAKLLCFRQDVQLVCSFLDAAYATSIAGGVRVVVVDEAMPWHIEEATRERLDLTRRCLEAEVVASTPVPDGQVLVVDGSIRRYDHEHLVGLVKSARTPWLTDVSALPATQGWRSPAFVISAARRDERDVYSCYLRLRSALPHRHAWDYGLVRVETLVRELLEPACALALSDRQPEGSRDRRADVHLRGVHLAEELVRAFEPAVFSLL